MIVVKVELWSAIDGSKSELARMHISNSGDTSYQNHRRGDYVGETFVGRDSAALSRGRISKTATVFNHARLDLHVWNLVAKMLAAMDYGPRDKLAATAPSKKEA